MNEMYKRLCLSVVSYAGLDKSYVKSFLLFVIYLCTIFFFSNSFFLFLLSSHDCSFFYFLLLSFMLNMHICSTAMMYCLYDYCMIYMLLAIYADLYGIKMNERITILLYNSLGSVEI